MTVEANPIGDARAPSAQALAWLVRLKSGAATIDDLAAFGAWRGADAANEAAYRESLASWQMLGPAFAQARDAVVPEIKMPAMAAPLSRRRMLTGAGLAVAAAVVAPLALNLAAAPAGATVLETRKGERRREVFDDGVVIDLNTDTRPVSWAAEGGREVRLDRGEALLAVNFGSDHHLRAIAGDAEVVADQARFLLSWFGGEAPRILCVEGSIDVRADGRSYRLAAAQAVDPAVGGIRQEAGAEVAGQLEWRRGVLAFEGRRAGDVIAELNRYRDGQVLLPASHAHVKISGVIHLDRADVAVDHIARTLGMKVTRLPFGVVILRS